MIDEPVAKASENSTKPNSAVAQSVRSAASRDRCMPVMAAAGRNSTRASRSLTEPSLFGATPAKRGPDPGHRPGEEERSVDRDLIGGRAPGLRVAADLPDQFW